MRLTSEAVASTRLVDDCMRVQPIREAVLSAIDLSVGSARAAAASGTGTGICYVMLRGSK